YFATYNLVCGPVVDDEDHLVGAVLAVTNGMYSVAPALVAAVTSPAGTRPARAITEFRRTLEFDAFL
ncbi:hypothetical protein CH252_35880, partial [Rhodococcus sp. 06-1477-1B]